MSARAVRSTAVVGLVVLSVVAYSESLVRVPVYVSLVPGLSSTVGARVVPNIGVSVLVGDAYRVEGAQISSVINTTTENVYGFQAAGVGNIANGRVDGIQGGGVFNIAARGILGFQTAGIFNIAGQESGFLQSAGVFNISEGDYSGIQLAGVFNITKREVSGAQVSGVFNVARDLFGVQVGLVNMAKKVEGVQVGIVNISEQMEGIPIGLINISRNGIFNATVWGDDSGYSFVGLQQGWSHVYTILYVGSQNRDYFKSFESLTTGFGVGAHYMANTVFLDADISAKHSVQIATPDQSTPPYDVGRTTIPSLRVCAGFNLTERSALFAGCTLDVHVPGLTHESVFHSGNFLDVPVNGETIMRLYPKLTAGFKL